MLFEYQLDAQGGVEGGSLLLVGGVGFSERSGRLSYLVCRFNSSMVSAVYVSGVELHCITPEHAAGMVSVEVSMNRQQFSTDGVQYEYVELSLYGVSPVSGPVRGGTLVTLSGVGLYGSESTGLYCMFGEWGVVEASYEGVGMLRCVSPDVQGSLSQGLVSVQVLNDDVLYMSSVAYWYEVEVVVSSIWPVSGLMSGGTLVAVYGSNLMSVGASVYCKFGGVSSLARVASGEMLHCSSPVGGVAGYVGVELSLNDQQYSVGQVLFEYQVDAHVEHVSPAKGGVEGGSLLIKGTHR